MPVGWNQDLEGLHQSRRDPEQRGTLANGLAHPLKVTAGEIPKPTVDDSQAICRGGRSEVVLVDDGHGKAPQRGIPCRAGSEDTGANDQEIERSVGKAWDVASHGGEGGFESSGS
jgi:hypothetical protein